VAELGNWNAKGFPRNDPFMIRNFGGAMDDLCLFGRALDQNEFALCIPKANHNRIPPLS